MRRVVALFGEAEKGKFKQPHRVVELPQLVETLGNPPPESEGLFFAIQALLYQRELLYFRVAEEGFSQIDYFQGLIYLQQKSQAGEINALCLPGVGDEKILEACHQVCQIHKSLLITNEKDLYDYLTSN